MSATTIFDKILNKEIPVQSVYEDEYVLAFRDIQPQAPVHVLVIPKKRWERFSEFKDADPLAVGEFFTRIATVASALGLDTNGYRIVLNNGRDGQQSVDYVHAHILGGRSLTWPPG